MCKKVVIPLRGVDRVDEVDPSGRSLHNEESSST